MLTYRELAAEITKMSDEQKDLPVSVCLQSDYSSDKFFSSVLLGCCDYHPDLPGFDYTVLTIDEQYPN